LINEYRPIEVNKRNGSETFHEKNQNFHFDVKSFWQWSYSDIISNATRGVLAEYLIAQAIGVADDGIREEWAAYDLETKSGIKIEVKSAAYIQSWQQKELSKISFIVKKTLSWNKFTNKQDGVPKRDADVYVFALLAHTEQETIDPLDISQWEFYVLQTRILDKRKRSQHSITLPSLCKLTQAVEYSELLSAIEEAGTNNG